MTPDESWVAKYYEVVSFIETNHRNPSKYDPKERILFGNWIKYNRKVYNAGKMKAERVLLFKKLLSLSEQYRHVNQFV